MKSKKIYVGTSGWNYKHWEEVFYPAAIKKQDWFNYYSTKFNSVEINNTFYNLPKVQTIKAWKNNAPGNFIYAIKASRYITHMKKLKDPKEPVNNFLKIIKQLKSNLGVILFQLPPHWKFNRERLSGFLSQLPYNYKYVFEFRDQSWWNDETYELLNKHNVAFCIYNMPDEETPRKITSDTIYIRMHGPVKKYSGSYSSQQLSGWKRWIENRIEKVSSVYIFFNNDDRGYAAKDALKLQEMVNNIN
jgi:uncharacterized protein YecE (DUF72 family)